ncbi:MAG: hypothetical protein RR458_03785, partial [Clostridia bacterium]
GKNTPERSGFGSIGEKKGINTPEVSGIGICERKEKQKCLGKEKNRLARFFRLGTFRLETSSKQGGFDGHSRQV